MARILELDLILVGESRFDPGELLDALNGGSAGAWHQPSNIGRIAIFSNRPKRLLAEQYIDDPVGRLAVFRLEMPGGPPLSLATLHHPSRLYEDERHQSDDLIELASILRKVEKDAGHDRTVLVGDLNMDPFDHGVASVGGLNAVSDRRVAQGRRRSYRGRKVPYFYNPMWGFFGDRTAGPPGSYHYHQSRTQWHIFDQVMVRPPLIEALDELRILRHAEPEPLTRMATGRPDKSLASDHLPILFRLNV